PVQLPLLEERRHAERAEGRERDLTGAVEPHHTFGIEADHTREPSFDRRETEGLRLGEHRRRKVFTPLEGERDHLRAGSALTAIDRRLEATERLRALEEQEALHLRRRDQREAGAANAKPRHLELEDLLVREPR